MLEAIVNSFLLVFVSEIGDKTMLLSLILAAKFRKPLPIMMGILVASILNHGLASYLGSFIYQFVDELQLQWALAITFIGFGFWMLVPEKNEDFKKEYKWGPFVATAVAFFFAEMADKTQFAVIALGAKYVAPILVTLGAAMGMLCANGLAVFFGHKLTKKLPMKLIHRIASAVFILFGIAIAIKAL